MAHDRDAFVRWDSGQTVALRMMLSAVDALGRGDAMPVDPRLLEALSATLSDGSLDPASSAPGTAHCRGQPTRACDVVIDVDGIDAVQTKTRKSIGQQLREPLLAAYREATSAGSGNDLGT